MSAHLSHRPSIRRLLLCSALAIVCPATPAVAQERDAPAPPLYADWRQLLPLDHDEASALIARIREAPRPLPDSLRRMLSGISHAITCDPPALRSPWGLGGRPDPPCEPAACVLLMEELEGQAPPADAFAFAVRWALDPERWSDSLLARTDTASPMLREATKIARAALEPGSFPEALPPPDASWREWLSWPGSFFSDRTDHYKLQLAEALRGRDIREEVGRGYRNAKSDSARLGFGTRAISLGVAEITVEQALRDVLSSSPALRRLGLLQMRRLRADARPLHGSQGAEIQRRMLAIVLDSTTAWPAHPLHPGADRTAPRPRMRRGDSTRPLVVITDDLEARVLDPWAEMPGLRFLTAAAADSLAGDRELSFVHVEPVDHVGPFAWVEMIVGALGPGRPDPGFMGYPSTFYRLTLLRDDGAWHVLSSSAIIAN